MHRLPVSASGVFLLFFPSPHWLFESLHVKDNASRCTVWRELVLLHKSHMEALSCMHVPRGLHCLLEADLTAE